LCIAIANLKQILADLGCVIIAAIQHWHFLFLAIANLNRQDLIGELLIFRNDDQGMILRSFDCFGYIFTEDLWSESSVYYFQGLIGIVEISKTGHGW